MHYRNFLTPSRSPRFPEAAAIRLPNTIDAIIADVQKALRAELLANIQSSPRLYFMYNRLEPQKRGPPKKTLMQVRHYLRLRSKEDRKAFTRLIASEQPFAIEKVRHALNRNYKQYKTVDRDKRLCRLGASAVESPEHALLLCNGHDDLIDRRQAFIDKVLERVPTFHVPADAREALTALKQLLATPDTVVQMVEFTHKVFETFSSVELAWPTEFVADVPRRNRTQ